MCTFYVQEHTSHNHSILHCLIFFYNRRVVLFYSYNICFIIQVDVTVSVVAEKAEKNETFDIYDIVQGLTLDVIADCALAIKSNCQNDPQDPFKLAVSF